jgi:hypothetical protein
MRNIMHLNYSNISEQTQAVPHARGTLGELSFDELLASLLGDANLPLIHNTSGESRARYRSRVAASRWLKTAILSAQLATTCMVLKP